MTIARIDRLRDDLIKRFENIVSFAAVSRHAEVTVKISRLTLRQIEKTDRNTTAVVQYQMQVETSALVSTNIVSYGIAKH